MTSTYFEVVIGLFLSSLKWCIPADYSLGNARPSQLSSDVNKRGIWPSPGAMLTISLKDILGPSTLCIRLGKC